jgi:hypothetical protein
MMKARTAKSRISKEANQISTSIKMNRILLIALYKLLANKTLFYFNQLKKQTISH